MATNLHILGKHTFQKEITPERIAKLALKILNNFQIKFKLGKDDDIEIKFFPDFKEPKIDLYIHHLGNGSHLEIYKNTFIIQSYYRYHNYVYKTKAGTYDTEYFADFRKDVYEIMQFFNAQEVIYLCDNGRILSEFLYLAEDGLTYEDIYKALIKKFGEPITNLNKIKDSSEKYDNYAPDYLMEKFKDDFLNPENPHSFYDCLNEFVLDRYEDIN